MTKELGSGLLHHLLLLLLLSFRPRCRGGRSTSAVLPLYESIFYIISSAIKCWKWSAGPNFSSAALLSEMPFFACEVANLTEKAANPWPWVLTAHETGTPRDMAIWGGDRHLSVPLSISQAKTYVCKFLGKAVLLHGFRRRGKAALLEMKWN